jgi:5-methyltetrahydrofolate corrinoid/iron sulfur protein methyltransferase
MNMDNFITIGENIHCTRVVTSGGSRTDKLPDGGEGVAFKYQGERYLLPVPANWQETSPAYGDGKIRHVELAVHHCVSGTSEEVRSLGEKYLCWAAERQVRKGANYLDVNVDEYTNDLKERVEIMSWLAAFLAERYDTPISVDSSNIETLVAGLAKCKTGVPQMVNSVSLEREDAVDVVIQYGADAVVSAAGKSGLPNTTEARLKNFDGIMSILEGKGMARSKMHLDPLVFPISVDPMNGKNFFESTTAIKERYEGANITGGLSNISFGMPNRKLINMVFVWLFVQAGGNGGIIDPVQMPPKDVAAMDESSEQFTLARAVLEGTDMFGGEYIAAFRDGRLK